jgi:hypothetical protein
LQYINIHSDAQNQASKPVGSCNLENKDRSINQLEEEAFRMTCGAE